MPKTKDKKTKKPKLDKKAKRIHIGFLGDESLSMSGNEESVVGGFNNMAEELAAEKNADKARITLGLFDYNAPGWGKEPTDPILRFLCSGMPLDQWDPLTANDYNPRGGTPLYDAIALMIRELEDKMKKSDKALVVIFTDGEENSSREFDKAGIRALIEAKEKQGFDFIFLGANIDAAAEAAKIGIVKPGSSLGFKSTSRGTRSMAGGASVMAASYLASDGDGAVVMDANLRNYAGGEIPEDDSDKKNRKRGTKTPA